MYNIRRLSQIDYGLYDTFLKPYTAHSMFLRCNAYKSGLDYQDKPFHAEYWGAFQNHNLCGVLGHVWNGNIMIQSESADITEALLENFSQHRSRAIAGFVGAADHAEIALKFFDKTHDDCLHDPLMQLYALNLTKLIMPDNIHDQDYNVIDTASADHDLLFQWLSGYNVECQLFPTQDQAAFDAHIHKRVLRCQQGDSWILLHKQQPVSLCGFNARLPDAAQVGPVWTPPNHRNKGYARILLAHCLKNARDQDRVETSLLFTGSVGAAKAYEAIGYRHSGEYFLGILKQAIQPQPSAVGH